MTDQLSIYNGALRVLRERPLVSLTDASKALRVLNTDYAKCLAWCAEQDQWRFAMDVTALSVASLDDPAPVGWTYAYDLPPDFARMYATSPDGNFVDPYNQWEIRRGILYCELPKIYVKYISKDRGTDLTLFSATYQEFVETALAARNGGQITSNAELVKDIRDRDLKKALHKAKAVDAMNNPNAARRPGSWTRSRNYRTAGEG